MDSKAALIQMDYAQIAEGYVITRGSKPMRTPAGNNLILPKEALAKAIVAEWQWQGDKIRKELLKLTPLACVAIDLASDKREAVLADVVPYIDTDMVCYRAGEINALCAQQKELLNPLIEWVAEEFGIKLAITEGMMPVAQPPENSAKLAAILSAYDDWTLAAFSVAVKPLGSAVLALALVEGKLEAGEAFTLAHLEESYETEKWGQDDEKEAYLHAKKLDVLAVGEFLRLLAVTSHTAI